MQKKTIKQAKEKQAKFAKVKEGFLVASLWITHVITIGLLFFSYILLPIFYNAVTANAWAVIIGIAIIPLAICLAIGAGLFVIMDLVKSIMSKKWWHITIACVEFLALIWVALTVCGVIPVIGA